CILTMLNSLQHHFQILPRDILAQLPCMLTLTHIDTLTHANTQTPPPHHRHTHTNTHRPEVAVNFTLCLSPIPDCPSPRTVQELWAASQRPGTKSTVCHGRTGEAQK